LKEFVLKHRQQLVNIYLAVNFAGWTGYNLYKSIAEGNFDYVELSFTLQNMLMVTLILVRWEHKGIDRSFFNQSIAMIAFFSGAAMIGQPASGGPVAAAVSKSIVFLANILGIITMLNLGRSFGILIAVRKIKTRGLYAIVRHPMYSMDILLRIGFIISHLNLFTGFVFIISTALYVYRAILEERFLAPQPAYRKYMQEVKYRFIPFIY